MALSISPTRRYSAMMSELPTSSVVVLYGGKTTANVSGGIKSYNGLLNDLWTWSGTAWSNVLTGVSGSSLTNPLPRADASMAFDGTYVTMVGGANNKANLSQIYSYKTSGGWIKQPLTDAISPPSNYTFPSLLRGCSSAYMSGIGGGEVITFGGISSFQRHYVKDTWVYTSGNPGAFTLLSPAASPPGRAYAAMASSSTTAVLFGGKNFDGALSTTYTFNGTTWSTKTFKPGITCPSARYGACMSYDANSSVYVLFGGITINNEYNAETWTYSLSGGGTWTKIATTTQPSPRAFASMAYTTGTTNSVLFGGIDNTIDYPDTWTFNASTSTWTLH